MPASSHSPSSAPPPPLLQVTTVDKYQGQQNDYVLLSLVRTRHFGHLRDVRRLVVAMSRSRLGLYVFGRAALFGNCYELQPTFRCARVRGEAVLAAGALSAAGRCPLTRRRHSARTRQGTPGLVNLPASALPPPAAASCCRAQPSWRCCPTSATGCVIGQPPRRARSAAGSPSPCSAATANLPARASLPVPVAASAG